MTVRAITFNRTKMLQILFESQQLAKMGQLLLTVFENGMLICIIT